MPRLAIHHTGATPAQALCGRASFQSARSALAGQVIDPTPLRHETDPGKVTCRRCLRALGALPALVRQDQDETEEE